MAKNTITQFAFSRMLPHGEPMQLQIGVLRDPYYLERLKIWRELLLNATSEIEGEIAASTAN